MTIEYRVDPERRIVLTRVNGSLTHEEMLAYQREAWSHPVLDSYDELIDMTDVLEAYRDLDARSTKRVAVFRTMEEAQAYLARPVSEPEPDGGPLGR